jgi:hypothetical protein
MSIKTLFGDPLEMIKVGIIVAVLSIFMLVVVYATDRPEPARPSIMIMRETTVKDYLTGGDALLVEYFVGGVSTHALFRPDQMHEYQALIAHLDQTGRLSYAVKR